MELLDCFTLKNTHSMPTQDKLFKSLRKTLSAPSKMDIIFYLPSNFSTCLFFRNFRNDNGSSSLLKEQNLNITEDEGSKSKLLPAPINIGNPNANWMLADKKQITPNLAQFEFKCNDYFVSSSLNNIHHLGKHMRVPTNLMKFWTNLKL